MPDPPFLDTLVSILASNHYTPLAREPQAGSSDALVQLPQKAASIATESFLCIPADKSSHYITVSRRKLELPLHEISEDHTVTKTAALSPGSQQPLTLCIFFTKRINSPNEGLHRHQGAIKGHFQFCMYDSTTIH